MEPDFVRATNGMLVAPNLRDQALSTLRARIIAGEITTGRLYAIGEIAEELGVSATPIREALLHLSKEGLISMARNRGFRVRVLSDHDLEEIVTLRRMMEVPAVHDIALRRLVQDEEELRHLAKVIEECAEASDWVGFLEYDRAFHLALLSNLGNERLVQFVASLRDQGRLYGLNRIAGSPELMASAREHGELLDLVVQGDGPGAAALMVHHLAHARGIWAGSVETSHS